MLHRLVQRLHGMEQIVALHLATSRCSGGGAISRLWGYRLPRSAVVHNTGPPADPEEPTTHKTTTSAFRGRGKGGGSFLSDGKRIDSRFLPTVAGKLIGAGESSGVDRVVQLLALVHLRGDVDTESRHCEDDNRQQGGQDGDGAALAGVGWAKPHSILISVVFVSLMPPGLMVLPTGVIHECW